MKTGFVICTRLSSSRIPGKALRKVNGVPILEHLIKRLSRTQLPIVIACPVEEGGEYIKFISSIEDKYFSKITLYVGHAKDPLARMYEAAVANNIQNIIRVTHDKIFVDPNTVANWVRTFERNNLEYMFSSTMTEGTGFEIIHVDALAKAREKYDNVEHISYAIKTVASRVHNQDMSMAYKPHRLLIDFMEDIDFMTIIFSCLGNECSIDQIFTFLKKNPWAAVNKLPELTIYTCGYNAERWINACMNSVASQFNFSYYEYILVDDHSSDRTSLRMAKFASQYKNVKYIRNNSNLGLSSSSNIALKHSRGGSIIRIDADDYFVGFDSLKSMHYALNTRGYDALYPSNYFGSSDVIQKGHERHHVGGSMFKTRAVNYIRFTDGLRNLEGYDFFVRAKDELKIGYYDEPVFFYRQHAESMSKTNLSERMRAKDKIDAMGASL
jgi:spore coat polysaccharide biosynthesis protein SpsF